MSAPYPRLEAGGVKQFVATYSAAPSTPSLAIYAGSGSGILVRSVTATASSATEFYAFVTLPVSRMVFSAEWICSFTSGVVIDRFCFQTVKHGS